MARQYQVPPSTAEKEKAIGGVLTFAQFGWLMIGVVLCLIIFLIVFLPTQSKVLGIIMGGPFLLVGVPFAFITKFDRSMTLFQYLKYNKAFKNKTKQLINKK